MITRERRDEINEEKYLKVECKTAREFLESLRLSNESWKLQKEDSDNTDNEWSKNWYFRGHSDCTWKLLPKAWRERNTLIAGLRNHLRFIDTICKSRCSSKSTDKDWGRIAIAIKQVCTELLLVRDFIEFSDRIGHSVPETKIPNINSKFLEQAVDDIAEDSPSGIQHKFWDEPAFALAQHHGIPTRLLDWTTNPLTAAYFAAYDKQYNKDEGFITVIAMSKFQLQGENASSVIVRKDGNKFLQVQEGVFTLGLNGENHFLEHGYYPDLMYSIFEIGWYPDKEFQTRKYLLPKSQSEDLIRLLYLENVTKAHLMPTLDNAAQTLVDKWERVLKI